MLCACLLAAACRAESHHEIPDSAATCRVHGVALEGRVVSARGVPVVAQIHVLVLAGPRGAASEYATRPPYGPILSGDDGVFRGTLPFAEPRELRLVVEPLHAGAGPADTVGAIRVRLRPADGCPALDGVPSRIVLSHAG